MAEPAQQTIQESPSPNLVQEIVEKGGEIPENYILKDGYPEAIDAPAELWTDGLLIDFSLFSSSTPAAEAELVKLRSALSEWGCFQAINYGIESSFLQEVIEASKQFFALPVEDKLKCSSVDDTLEGYGTDSALGLWSDRLKLSVHPEEKRKLQLWPKKPEHFREMVHEFSKKLVNIKADLYKAMARSLNLDEECFLKNQGRGGPLSMRINFYPRCPCPDRVLGGRPHTDGSTMTIVMVEKDIEGLQVEKDGFWYKVPVIPGALFINVGDMGEVMTNGVFKSMTHRVVANSDKERVSVASFYNSEEENEIGPVSELISDQRPQLYKKFNSLEFKQTFFETLSRGCKPLDALRL